LLPLFCPETRNYYQPLAQFAHDKAPIMVRDKVKAVEAMRIRMGIDFDFYYVSLFW
jgi:hypothetical protein